MHYAIYQIGKSGHEVDYKFRDYDPEKFNFKDYARVYEGHMDNTAVAHALDVLWEKFNIDHPADYRGHSLSVSDVVQLNETYYYCQGIGWKEVGV